MEIIFRTLNSQFMVLLPLYSFTGGLDVYEEWSDQESIIFRNPVTLAATYKNRFFSSILLSL